MLDTKIIKTFLPLGAMLILTFLLHTYLAFWVERTAFNEIIACYAILFFIYIGIYKLVDTKNIFLITVGFTIFIRFLLIFAEPALTDDFYRFVWDGHLWLEGISPFLATPTQLIESCQTTTPLISANFCEQMLPIYENLNSPDYFSIYPPVCQWIFAFGVWCFPNHMLGAVSMMKFCIFCFECGSIYLIYKLLLQFGLPYKNTILYVLNPLVIIELCGNLHFEAAMIFCLLYTVYTLKAITESQKYSHFIQSAIAMALAFCSKLIPLIFLPFFIRRLGLKKLFLYVSIMAFVSILAFSSFLNLKIINHLLSSVGLYFQSFEFNASIYYLIRAIGFYITDYNIIHIAGKLLAFCTFFSIFAIAYKEKTVTKQSLLQFFMWALFLYLAFATTIHPWYLCALVAFSVFTPFRFPIVWSAVVILSYYTYISTDYAENIWFVIFEYLVVYAYLAYELWKNNYSRFNKRNFF
ncbi:MAG: hypothetical protein ACPG5B_08890 [Chitinophagales bacterium]